MEPHWRDLAHTGKRTDQGPITYTMSPHLTIHLQFFQQRGKHKQHLTYEKIMAYKKTPKKYNHCGTNINQIHFEKTGNFLLHRDLFKKDTPVWKN